MFGRKKLSHWFAEDLAVDLGTANTLVFLREAGIVIREPSVVAVKRDQRGALKVLAVGREAKEMVGKTPDTIMAIRPLKDGVISDFDVAEQMLRHFIQNVQQRQGFLRFKPRIVCLLYTSPSPRDAS